LWVFLCELVLFPCLFTTYNYQGNRDGHQGEELPPKYIDVEGGLQDPLGRVLLHACKLISVRAETEPPCVVVPIKAGAATKVAKSRKGTFC
jgi:hypothetical protein